MDELLGDDILEPKAITPDEIAAISSELSDAESVARDISIAIGTPIVETILDAERTCDEIRAMLAGGISVDLDEVERVCGKLATKIDDGITQDLRDVYGYFRLMGFDPPSMDQIAYAEQTGDILGSMGISDAGLFGGSGNDATPPPLPMDTLNGGAGNEVVYTDRKSVV